MHGFFPVGIVVDEHVIIERLPNLEFLFLNNVAEDGQAADGVTQFDCLVVKLLGR